MQTARRSVGATSELTASVQLGVHHLDTGEPHSRNHIDGYATAVVGNLNRSILVQADGDVLGVTLQGLINTIVDHSPEAVHEAAGVGD